MIYVLGGEGFVGSAYMRLFAELELPALAVTRKNYQDAKGTACDVLINANGNSKKFLATKDPLFDFDASVRSVAASLEDFKAERYVFLSSGDVYPDPSSAATTREDQDIDISLLSRYGLHKFLAEQLVRSVHGAWLIVRMGGFVGVGLKKNAIFDILSGGTVWLSADSELEFIGTLDAARLVWGLVERGCQNEVVNLGAEGLLRLASFRDAVGSRSQFKPGAATVRYELSLDRLRCLTGKAKLPQTEECVMRFANAIRDGRFHLG